MATLENLRSWYDRDLEQRAPWDKSVEIVNIDDFGGSSPRRLIFQIYTDKNRYRITAYEPTSVTGPGTANTQTTEFQGYLGCTSTSRKPRAGEDWARGSDLCDGPLAEETWRAIMGDMLGFELVKVHRKDGLFRGAFMDQVGVPEIPARPGKPTAAT